MIKDKTGKVLEKKELVKDILDGYRSLSNQDSPSISLAKCLILAANVSRLVPTNSPVKPIIEDVFTSSGNLIMESNTLQDTLNHGITSQVQEIIESTDKGIIPPMAFNSFADDNTHPSMASHHMSDFKKPYKQVIEEAFQNLSERVISEARKGNSYTGTGGDFETTHDSIDLANVRKNINMKEIDELLSAKPRSTSSGDDSSSNSSSSSSESSSTSSSSSESKAASTSKPDIESFRNDLVGMDGSFGNK